MASQPTKNAEKTKQPNVEIPYLRNMRRNSTAGFGDSEWDYDPLKRSREARGGFLFAQSFKPAAAIDTDDASNGVAGLLYSPIPIKKKGSRRHFARVGDDHFNPHNFYHGSEAETFRDYWVKRSNVQTARAVMSKAGAGKPTKKVFGLDKEDENDIWGDNLEVDKETRKRLEEARLNALKNGLVEMKAKRR